MKVGRRHAVVGLSAFAHLALLLALLRVPGEPAPIAEVGGMSVSLYDGKALAPSPALAVPSPPPAPSHSASDAEPDPPKPTEIIPQYLDIDWPLDDPGAERDPLHDPVALAVAASAGAAGEACQLSLWLQQALQVDPQVQQALLRIPTPARSVANAIMIWDGAWVDPRARAAPGFADIRAALIAGIRAAPAACQAEVISGPEFVILGDGLATTILVVGSGQWRWGDMLAPTLLVTEAGALHARR